MPPLASSKSPRRSLHGVGEGALLVPEELALEQVLRDGAAVDRDERAAAAAAAPVNRARDELFADAALAGDEHRGLVVGDLRDGLEDRPASAGSSRGCPRTGSPSGSRP